MCPPNRPATRQRHRVAYGTRRAAGCGNDAEGRFSPLPGTPYERDSCSVRTPVRCDVAAVADVSCRTEPVVASTMARSSDFEGSTVRSRLRNSDIGRPCGRAVVSPRKGHPGLSPARIGCKHVHDSGVHDWTCVVPEGGAGSDAARRVEIASSQRERRPRRRVYIEALLGRPHPLRNGNPERLRGGV